MLLDRGNNNTSTAFQERCNECFDAVRGGDRRFVQQYFGSTQPDERV